MQTTTNPASPKITTAPTVFSRMLRNAGTLLGGKVAMGLLNLAATGIAIRSLGAEVFGTLILIHTFAQATAAFTKFQSWQTVLRFGAASLKQERRADFRALVRFTAWLDAGAGAVGILLCGALAFLFGRFFDIPPGLALIATAYATSTAFMVMATPTGLLRLFDRFDVLATRDTLGALFRLAGASLAALLGWGIGGFLAVWYLATALGGLSLAYAAYRELGRRGLLGDDGSGTPLPSVSSAHPGLWSFVWSTNLTTTLSLVSGHLGTLSVGLMLGPAEAALFAIALQIGNAALKPSRFLSPAIYPELARLAAIRDKAAIAALLRRVLLVSTGGSVLMLGALALLGSPLLRLVGGAQAVPAFPVMLMLATASAIGFASFAFEPLLISTGRHRAALRARLLAAVLYIPVALGAITAYGLPGAGLAAIFTAIVISAAQAHSASNTSA
ncbi:lipopolysaccharide biosynthesis protein [Pseudoroseomonas sp. WGS1072]|uniref:lipopolysaccharide biosynthesis protein n=1 Tax=Roseomonas sp. WGS1072 TaxID=3366816 RepID=UPI003BF3B947